MMGTIVAVANQKGGVGKTTITIHLAIEMARRGRRMLVVDADPQGNATSWLLDGDNSEAGLFNLFVVGQPLLQCVRSVSRWNLALLPGNSRTDEAMRFLSVTNRLSSIPKMIGPLCELCDVVLIDMPPSRSAGFAELLMACEWVLMPTQLERLALEGVGLMAQSAEVLRAKGWSDEKSNRPRLLGVVPNMLRQVNEHKAQMASLVDMFGPVVWPPLPLSVRVAEACSFGRSLFEIAPNDSVTIAMRQIVDRFELNLFTEVSDVE
jgi:chromosome partitioning protein